MTNFFTLLSIALVGGSTGVSSPAQEYEPRQIPTEKITEIKGETSFYDNLISVNSDNNQSRMTTRTSEPIRTEVITEAPGEKKIYSKSCGGTTYNWIYGVQIYEKDYPAEIVWDGNDVYFANIIFNPPYYGVTYVKGTRTDNKVNVAVPQTLIWHEDEQYGYNLVVMKLNPNASTDGNTYIIDEDITSFEYELSEDGILDMSLPEGFNGVDLPKHVLGIVYTDYDENFDKQWIGYCDIYQTFTPFEEVQTEMPEDADTSTYSLVMGEYGYPIEVAFVDDKVYFKGMSQEMQDAVAVGEIIADNEESMIVNIPQDEYVGIFMDETFVFTKLVYFNPDDEEGVYLHLAPEDQGFQLVFHKDTRNFTPLDDSYYLCFNSRKDRVSYVSLLDHFILFPQDDYTGIPRNPKDLSFNDSETDIFGFSSFRFTIPCLSTDGNLLDTDKLYYSIFVEGRKMEFLEEIVETLNGYVANIYWDVTEPTDMLPVWFENMWDIMKYSKIEFEIGLYYEGITTLGVQSIYTYGDKTVESERITLNVLTGEISSVDQLPSDAIVVKTEYFDLNGRRITNPAKGLYIKKTVLSDETVRVEKIIR